MRWILLSFMALSCACWGEDEEPPGELIGSFQALGLMVEQSCGAAVPGDRWTIQVHASTARAGS